MLKVGLYGFGGIARAHKMAYDQCVKEAVPIELVAVCDISEERLKICKNLSEHIHTYQSLEAMLDNETLDIVDICLPTYMHKDAIKQLLKDGYHVLCEKPMALTSSDCIDILEVAATSKGKLMIGQCLRFAPEYEYLKELVSNNQYGKVISAYFQRYSGPPLWGWQNWFLDVHKSGGCLMDQHIHDVDIIRFLFGDPLGVNCYSTGDKCQYDSVMTRFVYDDEKLVFALSDWGLREGVGFRQEYRVNFERATVILQDGILTLYKKMRPPIEIKVDKSDGIKEEIIYFVDLILNQVDNIKNPPESAAETIALMENVRKSADSTGGYITCIGN